VLRRILVSEEGRRRAIDPAATAATQPPATASAAVSVHGGAG
jgi:hypothetical protein